MEIVIKISEDDYEKMKWTSVKNGAKEELDYMRELILDGTPLPKGHGDLVDRDDINRRFFDICEELESYSNKPSYKELLDKWSMCMDTASTIIEGSDEE